MKNTLAVAVREIAERRSVLIAAAVGGLLPFASPLLPGIAAANRGEARGAMAVGIALAFGGATALAMGASAVARDLGEGRMTFDFARPLSWRAIWGGRFLGAIALTLLVTAAVLLPTALAGPLLPWIAGENPLPLFLMAAGSMLALIPLAHAASIAIRSRSRWLALDLVCGVIVVLTVAWATRELVAAFAVRAALGAAAVMLPLAVIALWVGSAAQVAVGRTDLVRGHGVLSRTVWSCLLGLALLLAAYTGWLFAASPSDLVEAWAIPAPRGSWSVIAGHSPGRGDYMPAMLFHTGSGRFERIGPASLTDPRFSGDGKRAILLRPLDFMRLTGSSPMRVEIVVADLTDSGATLRETTLTASDRGLLFAVSDDGRRVAVLSDGILSVYEVDSGATLVSARVEVVPANVRPRLYFASPDRVRLYTFQPKLRIHELDFATKRLVPTGEADLGMEFPAIQVAPGDRLFIHEMRSQERALLLDGRTGAVAQVFAAPPGEKAKFRRLTDGRVVAVTAAGPERSIRVLAADGATERVVPFPQSGWTILGGEVAPGKLVIAAGPTSVGKLDPSQWTVLLLDADTGELKETARGLIPVVSDRTGLLMLDTLEAGQPATRLFESSGALVFHDPLTGEKKVIAGRSPA